MVKVRELGVRECPGSGLFGVDCGSGLVFGIVRGELGRVRESSGLGGLMFGNWGVWEAVRVEPPKVTELPQLVPASVHAHLGHIRKPGRTFRVSRDRASCSLVRTKGKDRFYTQLNGLGGRAGWLADVRDGPEFGMDRNSGWTGVRDGLEFGMDRVRVRECSA